MPSKRSAVRKPRQSPTSTPVPDTGELEQLAEDLFTYAGLTPDSLRRVITAGLPEEVVQKAITIRMVLAMTLLGLKWALAHTDDPNRHILSIPPTEPSEKEQIIAVLNEDEAQWFLTEVNKHFAVDRALNDVSDSVVYGGLVLRSPLPAAEYEAQARWERLWESFSQEKQGLFPEVLSKKLLSWLVDARGKPSGDPAPARAIDHPKDENNETLRMLDHNKSFVQDGVRYFPLSAAAPIVQAPAPTILHWIKNGTKFDGEPLQSYYFAPANQYFIGEQAIVKAAHRFIKWPSQEPARAVILGEVKDKSGYIRLPKMAQILGVDHHTIWRWATKGTAPLDRPLDVIKDPASDQYHIRQTEAAVLKKHVPRAGLHAGRRSRPAMQPQ